jgi:hypothetical protein
MIMRPNYALKLTSAATAAPLTASLLRTAWRAARLGFLHQLQRSLVGWRELTGGSKLTLVMRPRGPTAQQT